MKDASLQLILMVLTCLSNLRMTAAGCVGKISGSPFPGNNKEFRMKWMTKASMILVLAIAVMVGFATVMPGNMGSAQAAIKSLANLATIKSISVSGEGESAELVIKLSSPVTFTSYKTAAPLRLVLDLSQASLCAMNSLLIVNEAI